MSAVKEYAGELVTQAMAAWGIRADDGAAFDSLMRELLAGGFGYTCKECGGPAPLGVGYVGTADGFAASFPLVRCACGHSQHAAWFGAVLVETIDGDGFPNVYVYTYRGRRFGVHRTWRSSPAGWMVCERDTAGEWLHPERGGLRFSQWSMPQTRRAAVRFAECVIDVALEDVTP